MKTVRRVYFYLVTLIAVEVVIWGVIGLARTSFLGSLAGTSAPLLANALSLTLVGLPVFLLHWLAIQRSIRREPEERGTRERALFIYAALLATLIPVVQNMLPLLNRMLLLIMRQSPLAAVVGGNQTWTDNLIAVAVNVLAAGYFLNVLRDDTIVDEPGNALTEVRRLYRTIWVLYGLGLVVMGAQGLLRFLFAVPAAGLIGGSSGAANGIALLLTGAPLWVYFWQSIQMSLDDPEERESALRLALLYLLVLGGMLVTLFTARAVLSRLLRLALGEDMPFTSLVGAVAAPLAWMITAAVVWYYHDRSLSAALADQPDEDRRAGLRRLFRTLLAAVGFAAVLFGLERLFYVLVALLTGVQTWFSALRAELAGALSWLALGLPLWFIYWRRLQAEAARGDAQGASARGSLSRKVYLYAVIFACVIGVMVFAGMLLNALISRLLSGDFSAALPELLNHAQRLALFAFWLAYHIAVLRRDGRAAAGILNQRHRAFPVLIIDPGDGSFGQQVAAGVERRAAAIPIAIQVLARGAPGDELLAARLVVIPATLVVQPPEALRLWLENYSGEFLVYPTGEEGWSWVGAQARSRREAAAQIAQAIQQRADGGPVRISAPLSAWSIVGYIAIGLFALEVLAAAAALVVSLLNR